MVLAAAIFLTFVVTTHAYSESFNNIEFASQDYGNMIHNKPTKVIYPSSPSDIAYIVKQIYNSSNVSVKIAARGNGHSIQGQAQTNQGIVIDMRSLPGPTMSFNTNASPAYVDVAGGELWIKVLNESLKHGLSPVSWTDYLYLTVGGTLSNAGVSGQTFKKGPQIDNVLQLEIVTEERKMILAVALFVTLVTTSYAFDESVDGIEFASQDYGGIIHNIPIEVVYPYTISDISFIASRFYEKGVASGSPTKIAIRGTGYSTNGEAQTNEGIVLNMTSILGPKMVFDTYGASPSYVDVAGGELWINVLTESVKYNRTPVSWTDYLHVTVGGTLSTAGISGQAFKKGPQIDSVLQLEIVTGKGELKTVTAESDYNLFYAVLGGLGQFGIITKARIALAPAPTMVKWIRALYSDFDTMAKDQEYLIDIYNLDTFDYVEGFVNMDAFGSSKHVGDWGSSYLTREPLRASKVISKGKTYYSIELAKYYSPKEDDTIDQKVTELLSKLNYIKSSLNITEVTYVEFLDRVHTTELELRKLGLWEIPHPWLNLLVPRKSINTFAQNVFGKIITESVNGPIIIYPVNKLIWKDMSSLATPNDNIMYIVSILSAADPSKTGELERLLALNKSVLNFCRVHNLGIKEYLPHYTTPREWKIHYGREWRDFVRNKRAYDPLAILAPGQLIFTNGTAE